MTVRNCDEAEEIAKKFLLERFGYSNIVINSVDFDGNFFSIDGLNEEEDNKVRFNVKISTDGNVVGWKVT